MSGRSCCYRSSCTGLAIVASIIIGIITAFLTITATITVTPAFLWVVFGIAVSYLAVVLITLSLAEGFGIRDCICAVLPVLLIGILGTILISVVLLAIEFAATSVVGAIITGLLLLFFSLIITETACLANCLAGCNDED
ncbi:MAG: hypothetical protein IJN39_05515 [Clostridia bacterium]|nr:hypothetical protein [Clostridia bacterium]